MLTRVKGQTVANLKMQAHCERTVAKTFRATEQFEKRNGVDIKCSGCNTNINLRKNTGT